MWHEHLMFASLALVVVIVMARTRTLDWKGVLMILLFVGLAVTGVSFLFLGVLLGAGLMIVTMARKGTKVPRKGTAGDRQYARVFGTNEFRRLR